MAQGGKLLLKDGYVLDGKDGFKDLTGKTAEKKELRSILQEYRSILRAKLLEFLPPQRLLDRNIETDEDTKPTF